MSRYSLYLHIPFCSHRCSYCDFNTYTTVGELQAAYATALQAEIRQVAAAARQAGQQPIVHTIFFGGGTPSLMSAPQMQAILDTVRSEYTLEVGAEVTMEANPESVTQEYLEQVAAAGINRLSFGVQSAIPDELALLGRTHNFDRVTVAMREARMAGFKRINLDLIYGVPGQTIQSWEKSVDAVMGLQPDHLSLYALTVEPGTPMQRWLDNGSMSAPDPDLAADQYELAGEKLGGAGFDHYEISNWARPGEECRHNLTYWRNDQFLGLGAGAHGFAAGIRYDVVRQPRVYIRRMREAREPTAFPLSAAVANQTKEDVAAGMSTHMMMQLRLLNEGVAPAGFAQRFGISLEEQYGTVIEEMVAWGLLVWRTGRLFLTERGRLLGNQVFYRFMLE